MTKRYRSSETGRYVNFDAAEADPDGTVSETVKTPDLEAGAEAFYNAYVLTGNPWGNLAQEYRDRVRHALRAALEAM